MQDVFGRSKRRRVLQIAVDRPGKAGVVAPQLPPRATSCSVVKVLSDTREVTTPSDGLLTRVCPSDEDGSDGIDDAGQLS